MRFKIYLSILCTLTFYICSAQKWSGSITYKKEIAPPENQGNIVFISNKDISSAFDDLRYVLRFNSEAALFEKIDVMGRDDTRAYTYAVRSGGGKGKYYTPLDQNYSLHQVDYIGELFLVKRNHPDFEITNETKMIGDYQCRKAFYTTLRKAPNKDTEDVQFTAVVWFTPAIPVSLGPLNFSGLPGMVLQVELGRVSYTATELNLSTEINLEIEKPEKGIAIEEKDLARTLRKMLRNLGAYN
ncbi:MULTISPECIES: GLPGLI family protein [unclassified Leeuwenhoekiella]|uniref:GLPGLI family protein n=1 Tax=unclassified Leeuwenhoekiella TaxID=2615029 RepID=UPI000C6379EB|nr:MULTISPECIES: GLPGLI family protein [unclassified Leeuwenhoekiella]MAW94448.1 hypothetical protein [Leeuwenhoekiella sp.]MBA81126.1 hypothetical protein [Leeuwenhoekiella sp.]|tara:strand:+ start:58049 stop:58774 length:726 start_codon:yes stop_codon:yes gene_type:complete